jgi:uncharacterized membrane protein YdjX (TVP38/TMEM64 family)
MTPPSSHGSSGAYHHRIAWPFVIQISGLFLAAITIFVLAPHYPVLDWLATAQKSIQRLGFWGGIVYPFAYAICNLLLLPGGILSVSAGFFFGLWWGFLLILVAHLLSGALAFLIARKLGRKRIERVLSNSPRLRLLDRAIERHGWKIVVLSQLNPLAPTSLLYYVYGLSRMRLSSCLLWTAIGQAPGRFLYAFLGTLGQLGIETARGARRPFLHDYFVWGAAFVVTVFTIWLLGGLAKRILHEVESEMAGEEEGELASPVRGSGK